MATKEQIAAEVLRKRGGPFVPDALSWDTAEQLPAGPGNPLEIAPFPKQFTGVAPIRSDLSGRPDIDNLYQKLLELESKPVDYSALAAINQAQKEGAKRDFMGGLGLTMFGDEGMRQAGNHVLQRALEAGKGIRPNAADTAYINPETGEVVQNPHEVLTNKRNILQMAIKQRELVDQERARQAAKVEADQRHAELQRLLGNQRTNTTVVVHGMDNQARIDAANARAAGKGTGEKPLSRGEIQDLSSMSSGYSNLNKLAADFQDEYSQGYTGKIGNKAENFITQNFPQLRDAVVDKKTAERMDKQEEWWRSQEYYNVLPERHAMFGSALTATERASWDKATIQPGMRPEAIRRAMATRKKIMEDVAVRMHATQVENNKYPGAVRAALAPFGKLLPKDPTEILETAPAPTPAPKPAPGTPAKRPRITFEPVN